MDTFRHVLLATDFAEASSNAHEAAMTLAARFEAELTLLHVCEIQLFPYAEPMLNPSHVAAIKEGAATRLAVALEEARQRIPRAKSQLAFGRPADEILAAIDTLKPDVVVMGTHGRRGVSHLLFGSVADKIVRQSPVPVLTTRGGREP
jgi:nucleotide-binding universal stress UspA family protein